MCIRDRVMIVEHRQKARNINYNVRNVLFLRKNYRCISWIHVGKCRKSSSRTNPNISVGIKSSMAKACWKTLEEIERYPVNTKQVKCLIPGNVGKEDSVITIN